MRHPLTRLLIAASRTRHYQNIRSMAYYTVVKAIAQIEHINCSIFFSLLLHTPTTSQLRIKPSKPRHPISQPSTQPTTQTTTTVAMPRYTYENYGPGRIGYNIDNHRRDFTNMFGIDRPHFHGSAGPNYGGDDRDRSLPFRRAEARTYFSGGDPRPFHPCKFSFRFLDVSMVNPVKERCG
jgi:hypothetical protein